MSLAGRRLFGRFPVETPGDGVTGGRACPGPVVTWATSHDPAVGPAEPPPTARSTIR